METQRIILYMSMNFSFLVDPLGVVYFMCIIVSMDKTV